MLQKPSHRFCIKDDYYDGRWYFFYTDRKWDLSDRRRIWLRQEYVSYNDHGAAWPKQHENHWEILYKDLNLSNLNETLYNKIRGNDIGMIFQDPLSALNPLMRIEDQIKEGLSYHTDMTAEQRQARALELLEQVGIPNPPRVGRQYPHELSGDASAGHHCDCDCL